MKSMEDTKVQYDMTIRNESGTVVQFCYGSDNFDPKRVEKQRFEIIQNTTKVFSERYKWKKGELDNYLDEKGSLLTFKNKLLSIGGEVIIPSGTSLLIESNRTVKLRKAGCLKIYGDLIIADGASLTLVPEVKEEGWSGIHFYHGNDRTINNLHVEGVGYGESDVTCGKSKYSGGVSFFNTKVVMNNTDIKNSRVEDSLHVFNSEMDVRNLTVENTKWDCLDSDYSVLQISNSKFKNCGGDGLDFSGSLFCILDSKMRLVNIYF